MNALPVVANSNLIGVISMERKSSYTLKNIISTTLIIMFCVFCSFSFKSEASAVGSNFGIEFFVNHPEPTTGDNFGYITLLCEYRSTGEKSIQTFFWTSYAYNSSGQEMTHYIDLTVTRDYLKFGMTGPSQLSLGKYALNNYNQTGRFAQIGLYNGAFTWQDPAWQILAFKCGGNAHILSTSFSNADNPFTVFYSDDGSSVLLMDIITLLQSSNNTDSSILNHVAGILNSVDGVEHRLDSVIDYLRSVDSKLTDIIEELQDIYDKADEILNEQKETNNWLQKIWNSIQEFFNPDSKDKETTDKFKDDSEEQSNTIDDLNEQNKVERPDADSLSDTVDSNLDMSNTADYSGVLATITNNEYVLQMILISLSLVVVAYILFGKRD